MNVELKRDGLTLRGELLLPEKDSYDIAILMHGFTGNRNGELLTALADALLEKGVASVRWATATNIVAAWILTIPATVVMSGLVYWVMGLFLTLPE